ncbi:MAG: SH3 domain-containing protein, partial [Lachnospiraceae bacterium]|nr:SH3 domain-containing protein [Lachnospiraceae bacterium]
MKKNRLPAVIAVILILLIVIACFVSQVIEKHSYSKERADLDSYFQNTADDDIAIILQDGMLDEKARLIDGKCYFDIDTVKKYLNSRFYADPSGELIYTLPTQIITTVYGEQTYSVTDPNGSQDNKLDYKAAVVTDDGTVYIAADFIKLFTNYSYDLHLTPNRVVVANEWNKVNTASITKDTQVRVKGGVKSDILTDIPEGSKVRVIDQMDNWSKVVTDDGFIGYVENKKMSDISEEEPIPVNDVKASEYTSVHKDYTINMAWHAIAGESGNSTLSQVLSQTKGVNTISPTWMSISGTDGSITSLASADYVSQAHDAGVEVWGLIDNFTNQDVNTSELLASAQSRGTLIANIMQQISATGMDGVNVDFESVDPKSGEDFIQFIRELSVYCRAAGKVLSIDNYVPLGNTDYYDRKEQGIVADYVVIMGYDEHYAGSDEAGSVASIDYVANGITETLKEVPADKIINGIPFYTRIWKTTGTTVESQAVDMKTAQEFISAHSIQTTWDDNAAQNYGEYSDGDT